MLRFVPQEFSVTASSYFNITFIQEVVFGSSVFFAGLPVSFNFSTVIPVPVGKKENENEARKEGRKEGRKERKKSG